MKRSRGLCADTYRLSPADAQGAPLLLPLAGFVQLLRNMAQADGSGAGPNVRVGGNSAELNWWDPTGERDKSTSCAASYSGEVCVKYAAKPADMEAAVRAVAADGVNGTLIYGLTMLQNSSAVWASELATGILKAARATAATGNSSSWRIDAFEIGNEPDLYFENGIRAPTYSPDDWMAELRESYLPAIREVISGGGDSASHFMQSGTFCCKENFYAKMDAIVAALRDEGSLKTWSQHGYGLSTSASLQPADLLADKAISDRIEKYIRPSADAAKKAGVPFVIGETNSINMGGLRGVSDTAASALWAADWVAHLIELGARRVNFHGSSSSAYSWMDGFETLASGEQVPIVAPLYYGMLAMARTLRGGAAPIEVQTLRKDATTAVATHAYVTASSDVRVLVINKDTEAKSEPARISVQVDADGVTGDATVVWLRAPSVAAKRGLSWGSPAGTITFDNSTNAAPRGEFVPQSVARGSAGEYVFEVPPLSVALLEVSAGGALS